MITRLAIVSDIHGDFAAFKAVVRDLDEQELDEVLVGGDVAEGGPQPTEVLDLLAARRWPGVMGNTDRLLLDVIAGTADMSNMHYPTAARAARRLGPHHINYLKSLPMSIRRSFPLGKELLLVHATPWNSEEIVLPDAPEGLAQRMLSAGRADIVVYGHIHIAYQRILRNGWLIGAGAVSRSNDQDPRPSYSILEIGSELAVEVRRVRCD